MQEATERFQIVLSDSCSKNLGETILSRLWTPSIN